ncbi:MAG: glutamine--fructose-6-phosphate transaminase (isomerizing) [Gammaproteobacteria bacterium]|nr:glutamine--fructose-6-phosphate transaminase (isomerizing) [Gammaproteobacteria bacterium]
MCGIVGAVSFHDTTDFLLEGLRRLEYRGYDSAGIALLDAAQQIARIRVKGKIADLEQAFNQQPITGNLGIGHTRWATHGEPCKKNAHPHSSHDEFSLVHNGIIENYQQLKVTLQQQGITFTSDTDSEVVVHLIHQAWQQQRDLLQAALSVRQQIDGAYALAIISRHEPERMIALRLASPLVIGLGKHENYLASDPIALLTVTNRFIYLEDGDIADIRCDKVTIYDKNNQMVERAVQKQKIKNSSNGRGKFRHYMLKEINEQPQAISATINSAVNNKTVIVDAFGHNAAQQLKNVGRVQIVACGTSYHAAMVARYWLEEIAAIPCQVEIASEIRYRHAVVSDNTLFITISQSGETADTLAALNQAKKLPYLTNLAICNVGQSSLMRASALSFLTHAGTEIGVASTKAFTTQLVALLLLTINLAKLHGLSQEKERELIAKLNRLPERIEQVLQLDSKIAHLAEYFAHKQHCLFLGRGSQYPVAMEGALKLKELSYIHAEAYPAGELKHGPLALVDEDMPVIAVAPDNALLGKLKSNLQEVQTRGGQLIIFADRDANLNQLSKNLHLTMPKIDNLLAPIVYTVPLQLLAYHVAVIKGTDVDQPRNLAKSVTVE